MLYIPVAPNRLLKKIFSSLLFLSPENQIIDDVAQPPPAAFKFS